MEDNSIHKWTIGGISEGVIRFADYAGKKILVVNVASECGYTPQYAQLQELYEEFRDQLVIIACPCNDFGGQEPGEAAEIISFCERNYGVSFPISEKLNIKKTPVAELYQWLTQKSKNGQLDADVSWNFHKFLLNEKGHLIDHFPSAITPFDEVILSHFQA